MNLTLTGTKVVQDSDILAFEANNNVNTINLTTDTTGWTYKINIKYPTVSETKQLYNVINLQLVNNVYTVLLTAEMLPLSGMYTMQIQGTKSTQTYHSDMFKVWVNNSINTGAIYSPVPSEFSQIEARITELNNNPPKPSTDGYWEIWNPDTQQYEKSTIPLPTVGSGVTSVNGKTGTVTLTASDVGAISQSEPHVSTVNGQTGDVVIAGTGTYTFTQSSAASTWSITHSLNCYPSVAVVDSGGNYVVGDVQYIDANSLTINFTSEFSGKAYLN